ncbi:tigger transposable element-derived protein 1-like [Onthophagus taurus]|uniref:tigger transposable element-derived protein 1-like n=1 Tax=Onthophagus taurus TaxID=166361 RepID=UPI0039BE5C7A
MNTGGIKKRNRKAISLQTKLEVLRRIDASERIIDICDALGLPKSTVQTIRKDKEKIKLHSQSAASLSVSKLTSKRSDRMEKMEQLLMMWIEDNNQRKMAMSQINIQEKAISIFEHWNGEGTSDGPSMDEKFLASRGWFEKFKKRHNLRNVKMKGGAASADTDIALAYPMALKVIIERGGYVPEQIFNVDETALYWKRMPDRSFLSMNEKAASGFKASKD